MNRAVDYFERFDLVELGFYWQKQQSIVVRSEEDLCFTNYFGGHVDWDKEVTTMRELEIREFGGRRKVLEGG